MKIIVTGAKGFIGTALCKLLRLKGHALVCPDLNILDENPLIGVFKDTAPDVVIHLAALTDSRATIYEMVDNNVNGTINVIKACRFSNVGKLIFASSCAVYGKNARVQTTEEAECVPITVYGITKRLCELLIQDSNIPYVIFRMFNVAGPGCNHNPQRYIIPCAIKAAAEPGYPFNCWGQLTDERDYVHIEDIVDAYIKALSPDIKNEVINLGLGCATQLAEIFHLVELCVKHPVVFYKGNSNGGLNGGVSIISANIDKAKRLLNWEPVYNVEDCVADAVNYYETN